MSLESLEMHKWTVVCFLKAYKQFSQWKVQVVPVLNQESPLKDIGNETKRIIGRLDKSFVYKFSYLILSSFCDLNTSRWTLCGLPYLHHHRSLPKSLLLSLFSKFSGLLTCQFLPVCRQTCSYVDIKDTNI